jgi:hypothetical protein
MVPFRVILVLFFALPAPALAQCQCIDVGDIKARMKEATTAIEAFHKEIVKMAEQMQRTQDPLLYTEARRIKLRDNVQAALNTSTGNRISATPTIEEGGPAGTGNLCVITFNLHPSTTACMRESIKRHEEHHQRECVKMLDGAKIAKAVVTGKGTDRFERSGASLIQYASEEITGYQAELTFLAGEQRRLEQACKPPKPQVRDYTAEQRNRSPKGQQPADPVKSGLDEARRRLGF